MTTLRNGIIDSREFLYQFTGGGDETEWNNIVKAVNAGTTPWLIRSPSPFKDFTYDPSRITFGGIEGEGRFVGAAGMASTASLSLANGVPRLVLPDGVTTDVFITIELEEWWLKNEIAIPFEWVNDHSAAGNVRFDFEVREIDIGTQGPASSGTTVVSHQDTIASPSAGLSTTGVVAGISFGFPFTPNPGPLASFYVVRITRLGGDALDTLAGPIGIVAASWIRTDL